MTEERGSRTSARGPWILAMVNAGVWAVSLIALAFVSQRAPAARGLFPILAGGTAVAIALISTLPRSR